MLTISAFASLAQLGAGIALALTIFLEPIQYCERRYRHKLEGKYKLIPKNGSHESISKENEFWAKIGTLDSALKDAKELSYWPILLIKFGATFNFLVLILCTTMPEAEVTGNWTAILLAICILPVAIGYFLISCIAKTKIARLDSDS